MILTIVDSSSYQCTKFLVHVMLHITWWGIAKSLHFQLQKFEENCLESHKETNFKTFIATCHVCLEKAPTIKPLKGAAVPIRSVKFRDRVQVDLVDFSKFAKKNEYGVVMRWLVNIKDHHTGFTVVDCIPRKRAYFVATVLAKHFSILGFPSILHTDN
jgi:hypothetical protein